MARGTALWQALCESLVGKCRGKASRESHRSLDPLEGKLNTAATARRKVHVHAPIGDKDDSPVETPVVPQIHFSTGEETSGSGTDSKQGLRPRHQPERNPERPPSNSHGDWPLLRRPERVTEVPVISREHLLQLEKSRWFSPPGEMSPFPLRPLEANHT